MISSIRLESEHVRKLVKASLERCEAINLDCLSRSVGMDRGLVSRELKTLVNRGEVEVLRPLPPAGKLRNRRNCGPTEHYRLLRRTDTNYLWEQEIAVRLPVSRMSDVREQQERRATGTEREPRSRW